MHSALGRPGGKKARGRESQGVARRLGAGRLQTPGAPGANGAQLCPVCPLAHRPLSRPRPFIREASVGSTDAPAELTRAERVVASVGRAYLGQTALPDHFMLNTNVPQEREAVTPRMPVRLSPRQRPAFVDPGVARLSAPLRVLELLVKGPSQAVLQPVPSNIWDSSSTLSSCPEEIIDGKTKQLDPAFSFWSDQLRLECH
ncbi:uncharacterized protein LOC128592647 [Nycticebus coucang]|uniref:uncharacterized protein LOC128592647 n=1 Tax=Nycticebus coucang TaxID=9470 RepID=UPI00234D57EE|nr:uncharacterized protein LOC128592647 [Nycticebus coucang]